MNEWFLHDLNSHFGWCRQWMAWFIVAENKNEKIVGRTRMQRDEKYEMTFFLLNWIVRNAKNNNNSFELTSRASCCGCMRKFGLIFIYNGF